MRTRVVLIAGALGAIGVMGVAACSDSSNGGAGGNGGTGNQQVQAVTINFTADDTANKIFAAGDLEWKGSMKWDQATGVVTFDSSWGGTCGQAGMPACQFPKLYDDGPRPGGHEPDGSTAGDHKWGVSVTTMPPSVTACDHTVMPPEDPTKPDANTPCNPGVADKAKYVYFCGMDDVCATPFEYGLIDSTTQGWLWVGSNGKFTITRASSGKTVNAQGITLPAFGTIDLKLVATEADLAAGADTTTVTVKGSAWGWQEVTLTDDGTKGDDAAGDGKYTFLLSNEVGAGSTRPHSGLLASGDAPEFVWKFNGVEYRDGNSNADKTGITASLGPKGGPYDETAITVNDKTNTIVTVP